MVVDRSRVAFIFAVMILCIGALAACGGGGDDDDNGNGSEGNGGSDTGDVSGATGGDAQQVFIDVGCAECHGENGDGDGVTARTDLRGSQLVVIEQQFITRVRNGRGSAMPAYTEEQISDEQIQLIYEWLYES